MMKLKDIKVEVQPYTIIFHAPAKKAATISWSVESENKEEGGQLIKPLNEKSVSVKVNPSLELLSAKLTYGLHPYKRTITIRDYGKQK